MSQRNGSGRGWGDPPPSPFKRQYTHACPYPGCGLKFGSKKRVGEHLENVHWIFPTDGVYRIPRRAPQ